MNELIEALQDYLRKAAGRTREVVAQGQFHLYILPNDSFRYFNYAIPDAPVETLTREELAEVRRAFAAHGRSLRFEFLHEYTPKLRGLLDGLGVALDGDNPLLICTRGTWKSAAGPAALQIRRLTPESPDVELAASINVGSRGFGDVEREATAERVGDLRRRLRLGSNYFVAWQNGTPVGVGAYRSPLDGFTELVGIATLPEFRRQGIAGALTSEMARVAFDEGAHTAFLTAADDNASRVYQRAGFYRIGTGLAYGDDG